MPENEILTDEEIVQALEMCSTKNVQCSKCPCFLKHIDCLGTNKHGRKLEAYVLEYIQRLQAQIRTLQGEE